MNRVKHEIANAYSQDDRPRRSNGRGKEAPSLFMVGGPRLLARVQLELLANALDEDHTLVHRERYIGAWGINHPETVPDEHVRIPSKCAFG